MAEVMVSVSVVSHGQMRLIWPLLQDLAEHCQGFSMECLLTLNLPEELPEGLEALPFPLKVIRNPVPLGFGANHNQAFRQACGTYFCILNPDIRCADNPFPPLLAALGEPRVWLVAPLVLSPDGQMEDSARRFPSPLKILCKVFRGCRGSDYAVQQALFYPEWVGGMFMLISHTNFAELGGFDECYFMYYEDVDLCARLRLRGGAVALCPQSVVVHHAQRNSHRNLRHLRWHLTSMLRFFLSDVYRRLPREAKA